MSNAEKIVVRFRLSLLGVFLVVPLVLFAVSYPNWQRGWAPLIKSDSDYYWVYSPLGYRGFAKKVVDGEDVGEKELEKKLAQLAKNAYQENLALGESFQLSQRRQFFLFVALGVSSLFLILFFWASSKIELLGKKIIVSSPLLRKRDVIKVSKIRSLRFLAAFPRAKSPVSRGKLGWKHRVLVDDGEPIPAVFSLSSFPDFTRIIDEVIKMNPKIKSVFSEEAEDVPKG